MPSALLSNGCLLNPLAAKLCYRLETVNWQQKWWERRKSLLELAWLGGSWEAASVWYFLPIQYQHLQSEGVRESEKYWYQKGEKAASFENMSVKVHKIEDFCFFTRGNILADVSIFPIYICTVDGSDATYWIQQHKRKGLFESLFSPPTNQNTTPFWPFKY